MIHAGQRKSPRDGRRVVNRRQRGVARVELRAAGQNADPKTWRCPARISPSAIAAITAITALTEPWPIDAVIESRVRIHEIAAVKAAPEGTIPKEITPGEAPSRKASARESSCREPTPKKSPYRKPTPGKAICGGPAAKRSTAAEAAAVNASPAVTASTVTAAAASSLDRVWSENEQSGGCNRHKKPHMRPYRHGIRSQIEFARLLPLERGLGREVSLDAATRPHDPPSGRSSAGAAASRGAVLDAHTNRSQCSLMPGSGLFAA